MIRFIYRRFYYRLAFGIAAGLIGYLFLITIFSLQYRYYSIALRPYDIIAFIACGIIITELLVAVNRWLDKRSPWDKGPVKRFLWQLLAGLVITLLVMVVLREPVILLFLRGWLLIFADELTIVLTVFFLVTVFNITELGIFLNRKYRESQAELERFRKENAEYQFEMLRLQLNPHFLFNSLNTLASLVYESADKASEFIRKLSEVYRYVLDNRNREIVPLKQEMEFISAYTFLLGIRFQGMVHFEVEIEEGAMEKQIAPMTVQLLIENAVKHNIASRQRQLTVRLYTENDNLWVVNNLQLKEKSENTGVGLKNIKSRYGFLTSRQVEINDDGAFFTVKIPLI